MENVKCGILCFECFQSKLKEPMAGMISKARSGTCLKPKDFISPLSAMNTSMHCIFFLSLNNRGSASPLFIILLFLCGCKLDLFLCLYNLAGEFLIHSMVLQCLKLNLSVCLSNKELGKFLLYLTVIYVVKL